MEPKTNIILIQHNLTHCGQDMKRYYANILKKIKFENYIMSLYKFLFPFYYFSRTNVNPDWFKSNLYVGIFCPPYLPDIRDPHVSFSSYMITGLLIAMNLFEMNLFKINVFKMNLQPFSFLNCTCTIVLFFNFHAEKSY